MKFLNEKGIVEICSRVFASKKKSVLQGIGDDTAILKIGNRKLLATTDSLQEKIHFDWKYTSPYLLGRKALAVNLSDIAAMGGKPLWALLSIAIPRSFQLGAGPAAPHPQLRHRPRGTAGGNWGAPSRVTPSQILQEFFRGLQSCAKEFGVSIVGGDTDHSLKDWKITITLLGEVETPIYRSGAKVGDDIWVTGFLGCSALGLEILKNGKKGKWKREKKFICAHLNPPPRVSAGRVLSKKKLAHSMIDVSDGLLLDLERLCEASKVGAEVEWENIPLSSGFLEICQDLKKNPKALALSGGEDYELLFTASPKSRNKIENIFKKIKSPVSRVGRVVSFSKKIRVLDKSKKEIILKRKGYSHFSSC